MNFDNIESIKDFGFDGFQTMTYLWNNKLKSVPKNGGVYMVIRKNLKPPKFLLENRAGLYKGKNLSLPIVELENQWVPGATVLYIGKAGGPGIKQGLHSRLRKYVNSGFSGQMQRSGGRLIWQLEESPKLVLCWKILVDEIPKDVETDLKNEFLERYGKLPFANLG